jgi:hypothetical protein
MRLRFRTNWNFAGQDSNAVPKYIIKLIFGSFFLGFDPDLASDKNLFRIGNIPVSQ